MRFITESGRLEKKNPCGSQFEPGVVAVVLGGCKVGDSGCHLKEGNGRIIKG